MVAELLERELAVLRCARRGLTVGETAAELSYSPAWVKETRSSAMRKLEARNIVTAVAVAMRRGLLDPD